MFLFWPLLGVLIGISAARAKGLGMVAGIVGGTLLGPLAVLMFLCSNNKKRCTFCQSIMKNVFLCTIAVVSLCLCSCEQAHIYPPITIEMRQSWVRGWVLQITNRSTEHLECRVYASNNVKQSKTFRFVLRSGETQEIGHLELDGWYLDPGEHAIISVVGYLRVVKVQWYSDGRFSWNKI